VVVMGRLESLCGQPSACVGNGIRRRRGRREAWGERGGGDIGQRDAKCRGRAAAAATAAAKRLLIGRCRAMLFVRQAPVLAAGGLSVSKG